MFRLLISYLYEYWHTPWDSEIVSCTNSCFMILPI